MSKYEHLRIEKKWAEVWEKTGLYHADDNSKAQKLYHLVMYPYPSGDLHTGHWYNFAGADFRARFKRMQGYNVMSPIGFDAFGLPAENAAIKRGLNPKKWTYDNIANMTKQLKTLGAMFDWDRTVITSDPEYYKWTQWMFLYMYKKGLAYKKKVMANWCNSCNTVLANEQVVGEGVCERCETPVVQKELEQWLFKITDYAEDLLKGLENLPAGKAGIDWPERTKTMQRNWIGKSEGAEITFKIKDADKNIKVFTTRPDTIFGATFMVLAPENPLVAEITTAKQKNEVKKYAEKSSRKTELQRLEEGKTKSGIFTGAYAINPANGKEIPIWTSDYVLMSYGHGAIMAVPAHDERDYDFAVKYKLPIIKVVDSKDTFVCTITKSLDKQFYKTVGAFAKVVVGNGTWDGLTLIYTDKVDEVLAEAQKHFVGNLWYIHSEGKVKKILFHSKDTNKIFDYGTEKGYQEAIAYGKKLGIPDEQLDFTAAYAAFAGDGPHINSDYLNGLDNQKAKEKAIAELAKKKAAEKAVNYKLRDWLISRQRYWGAPIPVVYCDKCGEVPVPEKDLPVLLPDEVEFKPTGESPLKLDPKFVNTKCPKCGGPAKRETDTMDTFVCSSWYYFRYTDPKNDKEFAAKDKIKKWLPVDMYVGGAEHSVLHLLYSRFFTRALKDGGYCDFDEPFTALRHQGMILGPNGLKMSKSKGNVVDPDVLVRDVGADSVRLYMGFMGPYDQGGPWNPKGLNGVRRFLDRVWKLYDMKIEDREPDLAETRLLNKTIKKVGEDIEEFHFNTAISTLMVLVNSLTKNQTQSNRSLGLLALMLAPFAPFVAEELWEKLGNVESIHKEPWPAYDKKYLVEDLITIVVQINGKVRANLELNKNSTQKDVESEALKNANVIKFLGGKKPKKVIYVPGKILNIVI